MWDHLLVRRLALGGLVLCLMASGCRLVEPPPHQLRKLPSGKTIKVTSVAAINFAEGGRALMMKYLTDINIDDRLALRREADEIWADFKLEVERANVSTAILSANSLPGGGIIQRGRGYNFVFQKDASGAWRGLGDK